MLQFSEEKKDFVYKRKKEEVSENYVEDDRNLLLDFSILTKMNEKDFINYINTIFKKGNKDKVIFENKNIMNENEIKNTIIRYYVSTKNIKKLIKIEIRKNEYEKDIDIENNYYLPTQIHDLIEENQINNILNIHRIKEKFNFLKLTSIGIGIKLSNAEKYCKEYLE